MNLNLECLFAFSGVMDGFRGLVSNTFLCEIGMPKLFYASTSLPVVGISFDWAVAVGEVVGFLLPSLSSIETSTLPDARL